MKRIILSFLISLIISVSLNAQEENSIFKGVITSAEDTGLGPFYGITVQDQQTKEEKYFMVMLGAYDQEKSYAEMVGHMVEVSYYINYEYWLNKIIPINEYNKTNQELTDGSYSTIGIYESGEIGDMGGYIYITSADGESITIMTEFEKYDEFIGKEVYVNYFAVEEYEVTDLQLIGD